MPCRAQPSCCSVLTPPQPADPSHPTSLSKQQAERLRAKAQAPDVWRSPHQHCRYLLYLGRIRAVQLEYSEARDALQAAARKAPAAALGFRAAVAKWLTLVRLLLGDVPERPEFSAPGLAAPLRPYFELAAAVRAGDVGAFAAVTASRAAAFAADGTSNLVTRLHHNVLRAGLRRISLAYSRISLADVASRLGLPSAEDAEFIAAKAIRDGGIDALLERGGGGGGAAAAALVSRPAADVYATGEPQAAFHARIAYCLDLHNDAVKAMRYEADAHKSRLESAEQRRERLAAEAELAAAIAEGGDDDDGDGGMMDDF
jgi:26S proteasome regulatory subunit N3